MVLAAAERAQPLSIHARPSIAAPTRRTVLDTNPAAVLAVWSLAPPSRFQRD